MGSGETEVRPEESTAINYGPGSLPAFRGFVENGFKESEGNGGEMASVMSGSE